MRPYYEADGVTIYHGDCLNTMRAMPENSLDSIVTDPPYGLSFMGKDWDHGVPGAAFWVEALRVAKPGAHLLAFGGTRTFHRLAVAIEDAGWEIRDTVMWVYGSGFPKSLDVGKASTDAARQWDGWGTALKPAWEPIIVARKPLEGTVAANVLKWGTGAINIDGCRVAGQTPSVDRRKNAAPGVSIGTTGWITPARPPSYNEQRAGEQLGRWPANLIHDGSDEVVGLFPETTSSAKAGFHPRKGGNVYGGNALLSSATIHQGGTEYGDSGSAARFFYTAKASSADRGNVPAFEMPLFGETVPEERNGHPTVKPTDLMRYLCRLVTPPGGIVLDPFMGSGSTGKAARAEGFRFVGCELRAEYCEIAAKRLAQRALDFGEAS